jgi:hypothetical protein
MVEAVVRPRHFTMPPELVRRDTGDMSEESRQVRARASAILADLLPARPVRPRLVASAGGTVTRMMLTVPAYAVDSPPLAAAYRDLLAKLPVQTSYLVLAHESVADTVRGWSDRLDVVAAPEHLHFSVWAEDGYAAVVDSGTTYLVEPFSFPRYGDSLAADLLANADPALERTQAPLYFQGGNILIGDDFFLIGADYPANTLRYVGSVLMPEPGELPAELIRRLYGEYLDPQRRLSYVGSTLPVPEERTRRITIDGADWTEILYAGNRPGTMQPIFHIDMFISLAGRGTDGRYRLLVGDPQAAADILGIPTPEHAMSQVFDDIATGLRRHGFNVLRNPLPLAYLDDLERKTRSWYFATANNVLVSDGVVYLPTYGHGAWPELAATDEANGQIWTELGFQVVYLADFHPFAVNLGAVHCIKKYLSRDE